jgi:hypothetical protein
MPNAITTPEKSALIEALDAFINQPPKLREADYGGKNIHYNHDKHKIQLAFKDARSMLAYAKGCDDITAADLIDASKRAFAGRLQFEIKDSWPVGQKVLIDYTTGQYWPTEYRSAAAAVLSSAIWGCFRDRIKNAPQLKLTIKKMARMELPTGIAYRYFSQ